LFAFHPVFFYNKLRRQLMPWIEIVDFTLAHKNGRAGSLPFLLYANQAAPVSASIARPVLLS
jgi:hypothetical protein